jgi:hypothetical protein
MKRRRAFNETEATARARAEVDSATRDKIANAHDHLADAHGVDAKRLRLLTREGKLLTKEQLHAAGLTIGEALAAGLRIAP